MKLLAELDLLKDCHKNDFDEDDDESNSLSGGEELSIYDSNSLQSGESYDSGLAKTHQRKGSNVSSGDFSWNQLWIVHYAPETFKMWN